MMTNTEYQHEFRIGDAVLADVDGAQIPGVIEDRQGDKLLVRLSEAWVDGTGKKSDEAWLTADKLDPSLEEETGGTEALPG
jgi:hypothetical protein